MIRFRHVSKYYGSATALDDVTFEVQAHRITALVGHNGAGKTTCLRMMVGLIQPDKGNVEINEQSIHLNKVKIRQQTSYVPDTPFISTYLTGLEHLQFQADVYRQSQAMEYARHLAERYKLSSVLSRPAYTYSHGMKQRLALIRALMIECPILLLDEPFNALDPLGVTRLIADLTQKAEQGTAVLVSSHLLAMLNELAQEAVVLKQGHVMFTGSLSGIDWSTHMEDWFGEELHNDEDSYDEKDVKNEIEEENDHIDNNQENGFNESQKQYAASIVKKGKKGRFLK